MTVLVVGAGLIGTSIGLALRAAGTPVTLADRDPARVRLAAELGAGRPHQPGVGPAEHAVLAVPPSAVARALHWVQQERLAATASDVASVKSAPLRAAAELGCDLASFIGGHPMAGRERPGPAAARADLFAGRPWVLTPTAATGPAARAAAEDVVRRCGAVPTLLDPETHDRAVALVSHAPQLLASALAARVASAAPAVRALAGQGLRDTTRLAGSDPELWTEIALANGPALAETLDRLGADLAGLAAALRAGDGGAVRAVLAAGNRGRAALPGKHSRPATPYAVVPVLVADEPGQLAALLADAAAAGVNVEDLSVEHAPGAALGVIELVVQPARAAELAAGLGARGWAVHAISPPAGPA